MNRGLIIIAAAAMVTILGANDAFAQRASRASGGGGGGGRGGAMSAPRGGGGGFRQPSMQAPVRSDISRAQNNSVRVSRSYAGGRPGYMNRPGYRPGYIYRPYYGYRPYYSYYNFYRPFIGFRINVLPYGYYPFYFGADQFYYSGGLFYRQYDNNYEVVVPPVGAEVPTLPSDAQQVTINGQVYYQYKGVYYTQGVNASGKTVYIVAGKDGVLNTDNGPVNNGQIGDIIDQLPEGCREVTIKNEKYYVSPDDVYYEEIINGDKTGYKVIGKLF